MDRIFPLQAVALGAALLCQLPAGAAQGAVIASWVQYAPGSAAATLAAQRWGDAPTSTTSTILVRAVLTDTATCPAATLDHSLPLPLHQRFTASSLTDTPDTSGVPNGAAGYPPYFVSPAATAAATFPNGDPKATTSWGECEAVVPAGHALVTVDGVDMKLPKPHPRTIVVMADTGCRMSGALTPEGSNQQNCSDPVAFPWKMLSTFAATLNPDLILHVGDWFYRDTDCLSHGSETFPGCNTPSSPNYETWGDTFDSWNADVLFPAKTLLATAPWIMVRGNHESCGRGARGWYALLDPWPYDRDKVVCAQTRHYPAPDGKRAVYNGDFEPSYLVDLGGPTILVHDSSFAKDGAVDANLAKNFDIDLSALLTAGSGRRLIFATHKPTFGLVRLRGKDSCASEGDADDTGNFTQQGVFNGGTGYAASAFAQGVPSSIPLFLSGHIHQFQYINTGTDGAPNARFAPQLIVGTGGSLLDADCNTGRVPLGNADLSPFAQTSFPFIVQHFGGGTTRTQADTYSHDQFGFALLTAKLDGKGGVTGYGADIYTVAAAKAGRCDITFDPRRISCDLH